MYEAQQADAANKDAEADAKASGEDVVDADFEEINDDENKKSA
jgi:molecular chaperone DnaK